MFTYDIALTLDLEVEKIWKRRFSVMTVLWFLARSSIVIYKTSSNVHSESLVGIRISPSNCYGWVIACVSTIVAHLCVVLQIYGFQS